ncbi:hypothetical protein Tco_1546051 [Tanacetum coccineum]
MMNLKGYEKDEIIHSLAWQRTAFAAMAGDDDTTAFLHLCFCNYNDLLGRDGYHPKDSLDEKGMEQQLYELTRSTMMQDTWLTVYATINTEKK